MNLLLVEDDDLFSAALAKELGGFGHQSAIVRDGRTALQAIDRDQFDAVLLGWMPPTGDGIDFLRRLRDGGIIVPVIILSARGRSLDKVEGLEAGADDYVVKPACGAELNARLHAIARARRWTARAEGETIRAGDIVVSPGRMRAWRAGEPLDLPGIEFDLLVEFARNAGSVLSRAALLERVWKYDVQPATNIVDSYVCRLRARLTAHGAPNPIATVRGRGYMLAA